MTRPSMRPAGRRRISRRAGSVARSMSRNCCEPSDSLVTLTVKKPSRGIAGSRARPPASVTARIAGSIARGDMS